MTVAICLDDRNGMVFNKRRQSRDRAIIERLLSIVGNAKIYINEYSAALFESDNVIVTDAFLEKAAKNDVCFVENAEISLYIDKIDKLIIYRWNKTYPADIFFNIDLGDFEIADSVDFAGYSHDLITEAVYIRRSK